MPDCGMNPVTPFSSKDSMYASNELWNAVQEGGVNCCKPMHRTGGVAFLHIGTLMTTCMEGKGFPVTN